MDWSTLFIGAINAYVIYRVFGAILEWWHKRRFEKREKSIDMNDVL